MTDEPDILAAKERHEVELMGLSGVIGVGIGECDGRPCIKVYTEVPTPEVAEAVPKTLDGHPVDVEFIGAVQALEMSPESAMQDIYQVQVRHQDSLLAMPGVVGVGVGDCAGSPCIKVFVDVLTEDLDARIPKELDGFAVDVQATGPIQAHPGPPGN